MSRKIRMGMVGGGRGAFIGTVHRMAAALDNEIELVCGAFSSDPENSRASGADWYLPAERCYGSWEEMLSAESQLSPGERMDFVSIVTPNFLHFPIAMQALDLGFHVVSDKPMTLDLQQATELRQRVRQSGLHFCLTHNYTGYPMVKQARHLIRGGALGKVRKVVVEYPQGWLATRLEQTGQKQAEWRADPKRGGATCCMGDVGTHAENLAEYVTGLRIKELCADLSTFVEGRLLDDDANVLLRFDNGARGVLHASQISIDEENDLNIRVYGETGGLKWRQEEPNTLLVMRAGKPREILRAGGNYADRLCPEALDACRLPAGHPEGFLEAFAVLYRNFARTIRAGLEGRHPSAFDLDFPTVDDGVRGMAFLDAVVKGSASNSKWTSFPDV